MCVYIPPAACSTGWGAAGGRADEFPGVWQDSANNTRWTETANKVRQWKAHASNSYLDPKQNSSDPNEAALGEWIHNQRNRKKQSKLHRKRRSNLTPCVRTGGIAWFSPTGNNACVPGWSGMAASQRVSVHRKYVNSFSIILIRVGFLLVYGLAFGQFIPQRKSSRLRCARMSVFALQSDVPILVLLRSLFFVMRIVVYIYMTKHHFPRAWFCFRQHKHPHM